MSIPTLSRGIIRQHCSAESFSRGQQYFLQGAVLSLIQRGSVLTAKVQGSAYEPYEVWINFDARGVAEATCSCPYDWGGWCKHIVAVLLCCLEHPEVVEPRPTLEEMLASLSQEQLRQLLTALVERSPLLMDAIEGELALLRCEPSAAPSDTRRTSPGEANRVRRYVRTLLHSVNYARVADAHGQVDAVITQLYQLLSRASGLLEIGDAEAALTLLDAITDEYVREWTHLDDSDARASSFFEELASLWTETMLSLSFSARRRRRWLRKLDGWSQALEEYGIDQVFDPVQAALNHGWDHPALRGALQGEAGPYGAWDDEPPWFAADLTQARLRVLWRQGRYQEYLNLARAEGCIASYVTLLVHTGQADRALQEGLHLLTDADQALQLAQALQDAGRLEAAILIAEHGLTLPGDKLDLATWLCDLFVGMGDTRRALSAALVVLREAPSLGAYMRVQELAGDSWSQLCPVLLSALRSFCTKACWTRLSLR